MEAPKQEESTNIPPAESPNVEAGDASAELSKSALKKLAKQSKAKPKQSKEDKMKAWGLGNKKSEEPVAEKPAEKPAAAVVESRPTFVNTTPKGEKKDLSGPMSATYQPNEVESAWAAWWEAKGFFTPNMERAKSLPVDKRFIMVIPPPNVTGSLHLGHALTVAIEDSIVRWRRMSGYEALWVPGTDHAGIATQVVVEKTLQKQGIKRLDLGREKFVEKVWEWKDNYAGNITNQLRRIGTSVDWTREAFTMDDNLTLAVKEAFVRLYEQGLIYRANRLVNWCCQLRTAISDIEVEYVELEGKTLRKVPGHGSKQIEFGCLTEFAYPVEDSDERLVVATTRLETMLGDTAIAVHPLDPRYTHLHGKHVIHPINKRRIPIVCDDVLVDMSFGTGAVKVTPAHDPNDFECGKRHDLQFINIFDEEGRMNDNGAPYSGMMRFDVRVKLEEDLRALGLIVGKKENKMQIPVCSRTGDIVEPMMKPQWYVRCEGMAKRALDAVQTGELRIYPDFHVSTWNRWMEGMRDWCVSRQLWWGHRIPAYKVLVCRPGEPIVDNDVWVVGRDTAEAMKKAVEVTGESEESVRLEQDPDVLDTWFSSGLFPFSVMGWPKATEDLDTFFPNSLLETGLDIIFFWVARMVMMSLQLMNKLPFNTVYLHAMIRDKYGRKMSKSLGNVIDPLEVIDGCDLETMITKIKSGNLDASEVEKASLGKRQDFPSGIPMCGSDALRFGLLAYTLQGVNINLDIQRVIGYRNFCNKLWNAVKFALMNLEGFKSTDEEIQKLLSGDEMLGSLAWRDQWILSKLAKAIELCNKNFESYDFAGVTMAVYNYWLYMLCDRYLEMTKQVFNGTNEQEKRNAQITLFVCIEMGLRLIHPIMPFVSEELWQRVTTHVGVQSKESIMLCEYPIANTKWMNESLESEFELLETVAANTRSLKADYNITRKNNPLFFIVSTDESSKNTIQKLMEDYKSQAQVSDVEIRNSAEKLPSTCAEKHVDSRISIFADLKGIVDFAQEVKKIEKSIAETQSRVESYREKQSVKDYEIRVPEAVRTRDADKLAEFEAELEKLKASYERYQKFIESQ